MTGLRAWAVEGVGEVRQGADLVALLAGTPLEDGDVVVVTSKVVSKAEGRSGPGDRDAAVAEETVRVVARRGRTEIVENRLGLVMAAAGVDASNVEPGHLVRLPLDPDASARRLREQVAARRGVRVAVVVTDTSGRAWRQGQTDLAIGAAGLPPLLDLAGRADSHGNVLAVTAPAVADELAGVAELVTGKLGGRPLSVVRGLGHLVLPADDHGPGARALLRERSQDMFALGSREAVVAALAGTDADCFGAPAEPEEVLDALRRCGLPDGSPDGDDGLRVRLDPTTAAADRVRLRTLLHALVWHARPGSGSPDGAGDVVELRPGRSVRSP